MQVSLFSQLGHQSVSVTDVHDHSLNSGIFAELLIELLQRNCVLTLLSITNKIFIIINTFYRYYLLQNSSIPQSVVKCNDSSLSQKSQTQFKVGVVTSLL